ncbi:MAG: DsbE family thiol:disulfide interchange protein [Gammaproteobacteria bacterium]
MRRWLWGLVPLAVAAVLVAVFAFGFGRNPKTIPSPLVGKAVPKFSLSTLNDPATRITPGKLRGHPVLINIFASWCVACTDESKTLRWLAGRGVTIYGLDYSDTRGQAHAWLRKWGNPYRKVLFDPTGEAGVAFGIYGVPETFVVDASGRIRRKFTGIIDMKAAKTQVLPLMRKLEAGS